MKVVAFDTGLGTGGVCLLDTAGGASYVGVVGLRGKLSGELFVAVRELLEEAVWSPSDVDLLVCSSGPGSFTGLRVGVAAVKGWYAAVGCAVKAVGTFDVLASAVGPADRPAVGLIDARGGRAYWALFPRPSARPEPRVSPVDRLRDVISAAAVVFGPDRRFMESVVRAAGVSGARVVETPPDPLALARLGAARFEAEGADDPEAVAPVYVTSGQV